MVPWLYSWLVSGYHQSWFFSIQLYILRIRLEGFITSSQFPFRGVLEHSWTMCPHLSHWKYLTHCKLLLFFLTMFIFLFLLFLLPNCPGFTDVVFTGNFCITTHNCMICSLKVKISSPHLLVLVWPSLLPKICPHIQTNPYGLQSQTECTWPSYKYCTETYNCFWGPWMM